MSSTWGIPISLAALRQALSGLGVEVAVTFTLLVSAFSMSATLLVGGKVANLFSDQGYCPHPLYLTGRLDWPALAPPKGVR